MSAAKDISVSASELARPVMSSLGLSISPIAGFQPQPAAKQLKPFATEDIKILLLENVNQTGRDILSKQGYQVEFLKSSLPEDQLIEKIRYSSP